MKTNRNETAPIKNKTEEEQNRSESISDKKRYPLTLARLSCVLCDLLWMRTRNLRGEVWLWCLNSLKMRANSMGMTCRIVATAAAKLAPATSKSHHSTQIKNRYWGEYSCQGQSGDLRSYEIWKSSKREGWREVGETERETSNTE